MTPRKPFVLYKLPGSRKAIPQTPAGWAIFASFMTVTLAPVIAMAWVLPRYPNAMMLYLVLLPAIIIGFITIVVRNADVVDLRADPRGFAEFRAWQARKRRGGGQG